MSNKKLTGTLIPKDNKKAKMHAAFYSDKPVGSDSDSEIFNKYVDATDQQRNTALANVSNQNANSTTGKMGYKVLDGSKSFASQVTAENTIYEIRDVFDLCGNEITIPTGCTLKFNGGLLKNGTAKGTLTSIDADIVKIFDLTLSLSGSWNEIGLYPEQYGYNSGQDLNTFVSKIYDAFTSVKFDKGSYTVTEPLYIKGSLYAPETLFYLTDNGVLITDSSSGKHQDNYGLHNVTIDIYRITGNQTNYNNTVDYGLVLNNLNSSEVRVKQINKFIKGGVLLHGNGQGVAYNRFLFGWIYDCDECCIRAKVSSANSQKGWVNANYFYNFRLSASSSYPNCQAMIWEDPGGASLYYGNVFSQGTLEGFNASPLITVNNFSGNVFNNIIGDQLYSYKFLGNNRTRQNIITQSNPHARGIFWSNAGFIVHKTSMLCKQLVFDSGYLNERFLHYYYNSTSNVDFYVDKGRVINSINYTNTFNYSTRLIIDNTNKKVTQNYATANVAMGIIIDTSEERTFGLLLSEPHAVGIRYLTVDGADGTDANNQSAGAPITSYDSMSWNTDFKNWRLDSSSMRDSSNYIEFTVPTTVSKLYISFLMSSSAPSISYFRIFGANNRLRVVPYQNDLPYGPTTERPKQAYDGQTYFDSNLGKMIVALNSTWVNLDGTPLS